MKQRGYKYGTKFAEFIISKEHHRDHEGGSIMRNPMYLTPKQRPYNRLLVIPFTRSENKNTLFPAMGLILLIVLLLMATIRPVWAHGGKSHSKFTALQALQKSADLYNKLLSSGKLDETWEVGLIQVAITSPGASGRKEFVIRFSRNSGDPEAVFFFLTEDGKYAGSNFGGPESNP